MQSKLRLYTVTEIANWFLSRAALSPKKLQKLVYYTQAWSNALLQRPLIDAEFEAWPAGPVEVNLQHQYQQYGWTKIPQQAIQPIKFDDADVEDLLAAVWETYQDQSGD